MGHIEHREELPKFVSPLSETASQLFDDLETALGDTIPEQTQRDIHAFFDLVPLLEFTLTNNCEAYPNLILSDAQQLGRTYGALETVDNLLSVHTRTLPETEENWFRFLSFHETVGHIKTLMRLTFDPTIHEGRDDLFDLYEHRHALKERKPTSYFISEALNSHIDGNANILLKHCEDFLSSTDQAYGDIPSQALIHTVVDALTEFLHEPSDRSTNVQDMLTVLSIAREKLSSTGIIHGQGSSLDDKSFFSFDPLKIFTQLDAYPKLRAAYTLHGALMYADRHTMLDQSLNTFWRTIHPIAWGLTNSIRLANQKPSIDGANIQADMPHDIQMNFWKLSELLFAVKSGQLAIDYSDRPNIDVQYAQSNLRSFRNNPLSLVVEMTYGSFDSWYNGLLNSLHGGEEEHDSFVAAYRAQLEMQGQHSQTDDLVIEQLYFEEIEYRTLMQWIGESDYVLDTTNPAIFSEQISEYRTLYEEDMKQRWKHSNRDDRLAFVSALKRATPTDALALSDWNRMVNRLVEYALEPTANSHILEYINDNQLYKTFRLAYQAIRYSDKAIDELYAEVEDIVDLNLADEDNPLTYAGVFRVISNIFIQKSEDMSPSRAAMTLFGPTDRAKQDAWIDSCRKNSKDWEQLVYDMETVLLLLN